MSDIVKAGAAGAAVGAVGGPVGAGIGGLIGAGLQGAMNVGSWIYNLWNNKNKEDREDSAVQRRVADLKAAGLSPVLAAGSAAQTMGPQHIDAPDVQSPVTTAIDQQTKMYAQKKMDMDTSLTAQQIQMNLLKQKEQQFTNALLGETLDSAISAKKADYNVAVQTEETRIRQALSTLSKTEADKALADAHAAATPILANAAKQQAESSTVNAVAHATDVASRAAHNLAEEGIQKDRNQALRDIARARVEAEKELKTNALKVQAKPYNDLKDRAKDAYNLVYGGLPDIVKEKIPAPKP